MSHPESIGAYVVVGVVGEGGMGVVYRGRHRLDARAAQQGDVALKLQHVQMARDPDLRERFEREAELGLTLEHPGIVRVLDLVDTPNGAAVVMELIDGVELDRLQDDGATLNILDRLSEALDYLHERGVIHRDGHGRVHGPRAVRGCQARGRAGRRLCLRPHRVPSAVPGAALAHGRQ